MSRKAAISTFRNRYCLELAALEMNLIEAKNMHPNFEPDRVEELESVIRQKSEEGSCEKLTAGDYRMVLENQRDRIGPNFNVKLGGVSYGSD